MDPDAEPASSSSAPTLPESLDDTSKRNVLSRKLQMLQREERAIQSLLVHLRSQGRLIELEKIRLQKLQDERRAAREQLPPSHADDVHHAAFGYAPDEPGAIDVNDASSEVSLALEPPTAASSSSHSKA